MALKDKLMTLEDFKAVRDVDVASNNQQFTDIKADLDALDSKVDNIDPFSNDAKAALLACIRHVARWEDGNGQTYYNNLYAALYPGIVPVSISATFTQGQAIIYDTDNLAALRPYLTVTATMAGGTTETVTDYTLTGTLVSGTSTITVTYQTKTTTFTVTVTHNDVPDIGTGEIVQGYYFDASGNEVASNNSVINRTYYPVSPSTTYKWIQGFQGNTRSGGTLKGAANAYRICYYTADKTFISREINAWGTNTWEYIEPRYYEFTTPANAAYIRVSCNLLTVGQIYKTIPSTMYAVVLLLANPDDSNISSIADLAGRVSVIRDGVDITSNVMSNGKTISDISLYWRKAVFSLTLGKTTEAGTINESETRMFNQKTLLLEAGDVIKFNNVKYGVRCEKVVDGSLAYTTAWVTDNSDYTVGA